LLRDPAVPPDLPPPWPDLLAAMTDRDPTRRPSAAQVAATLAADPADVTPIAQAERPPTTVVLTRPAVRAEPAKPRRRQSGRRPADDRGPDQRVAARRAADAHRHGPAAGRRSGHVGRIDDHSGATY
jgi:hypothetical protein